MQTYKTHWNTWTPFFVKVSGKKVLIEKNSQKDPEAKPLLQPVATVEADKIFLGHPSTHGGEEFELGANVLIKRKTDYVFVGKDVYSFKTMRGDEIIQFFCDIGQNDVPYSYAVGQRYTYLLTENALVNNMQIPSMYSLFYRGAKALKNESGALHTTIISKGF
jgi:hypothetical protein